MSKGEGYSTIPPPKMLSSKKRFIACSIPAQILSSFASVLFSCVFASPELRAVENETYLWEKIPLRYSTTGSSASCIGAEVLSIPTALAADLKGNVYVSSICEKERRGIIHKIAAHGDTSIVAKLPDSIEFGDPNQDDACGYASEITVDREGKLFVVGMLSAAVWTFTTDGKVRLHAGNTHVSGSRFDHLTSIGMSRAPEDVRITDRGTSYDVMYSIGKHCIEKSSGGVTTVFAGDREVQGQADGPGSKARFNGPFGIHIDQSGVLFAADVTDDGTKVVRRITASGVVSTLTFAESGDDGVWQSRSSIGGAGIAVGKNGTVYVSLTFKDVVRKLSTDGSVTTLAGVPGVSGNNDGIGSVARFNGPKGLALDANDNLYVADIGNNRVRKVTPDGNVSTLGGEEAASKFRKPYAVAVDSNANVYVAARGTGSRESKEVVCKISKGAQVSVIWEGDEGDSQYIAADSSGNLYRCAADGSLFRGRPLVRED